jgi:hypothetical protein
MTARNATAFGVMATFSSMGLWEGHSPITFAGAKGQTIGHLTYKEFYGSWRIHVNVGRTEGTGHTSSTWKKD